LHCFFTLLATGQEHSTHILTLISIIFVKNLIFILELNEMQSQLSELICCPKCKHDLLYSGKKSDEAKLSGILLCQYCRSEFTADGGFIHFIRKEEVFRSSKREKFFRSVYASFYTPLTNFMFLPCGGAKMARTEVLEQLEIRPGAAILETGIGTGDNMPYMKDRLKSGSYYGLDNQMRMLRSCARNNKKWNLPAKLYLANAEQLPFKDNSFDVVFHLGAINLFRQKKKAIDEMIRVAKPGTRIVIADETDRASKYFAIFVGKQEPIVPPVALIPKSMLEIKLDIIWKGYGYLITFRKPKNDKLHLTI
jgi:ubiquinone/menaquinone biosynthesis C-methylase UbiE/uncharacterized protein YbaR (Trm112 family)